MNSDPAISHVEPKPSTLVQMKHYGTKWEIVLKTLEGQFRLAFMAIKTRKVILHYGDEYVEISAKCLIRSKGKSGKRLMTSPKM